jgi:membrane-bound lytic murein transglycosylase A
MRTVAIALLVASCAFLAGCPKAPIGQFSPVEDFDRPLPPGELALRKITNPADLPDITMACQFTYDMRPAITHSLNYMAKPSSQRFFPYGEITHHQVVESLKAMDAILATTKAPEQMRDEIMQKFDVYTSVGWDGSGTVLFTGYYTPIFSGSMQKTDVFRCPLYKSPPGLQKDADGNILGMKGKDGVMRKMPPRGELEASGALAGCELAWMADPFEVYIAHVQGSAKLRLPDGKLVTVGYAANNGYEYNSVGKEMIAEGKIEKKDLSLAKLISYFKEHPDDVASYVNRNPRFVFFDMNEGPPRGSLNEPVTPRRSIATDKEVYPRACIAMVAAPLPLRHSGGVQVLPYQGFALDQDTGGAIRAPGRCDIYVGVGDQAAELAGQTYNKGRLYYFFLKPAFVPPPVLKPATTAPTPAGPARPRPAPGGTPVGAPAGTP